MNSPTSRYPFKRSQYASHNRIANYLNSKSQNLAGVKILDVGCAQGELRSLIENKNLDYIGIEPFRADFEIAQANGVRVLNLTAEAASSELNEAFDFIVFADVLEHLVDPESVLASYRSLLKPGGEIIVSIPNVAHFTNRLNLLIGKWNYTERGILDKTHLKFYTKASFESLLQQMNFHLIGFFPTPIPIEAVIPDLNRKILLIFDKIQYIPTRLLPKLFAFQNIWIISG